MVSSSTYTCGHSTLPHLTGKQEALRGTAYSPIPSSEPKVSFNSLHRIHRHAGIPELSLAAAAHMYSGIKYTSAHVFGSEVSESSYRQNSCGPPCHQSHAMGSNLVSLTLCGTNRRTVRLTNPATEFILRLRPIRRRGILQPSPIDEERRAVGKLAATRASIDLDWLLEGVEVGHWKHEGPRECCKWPVSNHVRAHLSVRSVLAYHFPDRIPGMCR